MSRLRTSTAAVFALACNSQAGDTSLAFTTALPSSSSDGTSGDSGTSVSSTGAMTGAGATTSTTGSTSSSSDTGTSDAISTTIFLDVGSDKDLGTGTPAGCKGKIDFLFVISREPVMYVVQAQLADAWPKFIDTIASKFEDFDYHIMVVDADEYWGIPWQCDVVCPDLSCKVGDPCCPEQSPKGELCCPVSDYPCDELGLVTACDETLGAGTVFNGGKYASNEPCKVDGDRRYLTKGQSNLDDTFVCIAEVGIAGGNQIGAALAAAVSPELNAPAACNDGFLRDDALLMVTLVTPGSDDSYSGTIEEWYQAVVDAKHGDPGAIVMFVLGNPSCPKGDVPCELAMMFPHVLVESGLADDYGPAFKAATSLLEKACDALVPG